MRKILWLASLSLDAEKKAHVTQRALLVLRQFQVLYRSLLLHCQPDFDRKNCATAHNISS